jgi:hypothetical protein
MAHTHFASADFDPSCPQCILARAFAPVAVAATIEVRVVADLDAKLPDGRSVLESIEELAAAGWDRDSATGRFDWEYFLQRVERYLDVDLPGQMDDPVIRRIQRAARAAAAEVD